MVNALAEKSNHFILRSGRTGKRIDHSLDFTEAVEASEFLAQQERQVIHIYAQGGTRYGTYWIATALPRR